MDIHSLERFCDVQRLMFPRALCEVQNGRKLSHWMWYIFPQLRALGKSATALAYGIEDEHEARKYLASPELSSRLTEISLALLRLDTNDPEKIFGTVDAMKLRSSMTLFAYISEDGSVFHKVLDKFYGGKHDALTLSLLSGA